ncbi:cation acetate symporter [Streptomyces lunaelactis]|uniref:sodium/solute symporter n=1 Tax=Streptomyces lunaelactis TaxID=1535768 RepID=UPI00158579DE|nr:cation acetate symporter [Streptomyces lunaelactis]NUK07207.1 cation acetate symporter [Streptomyces lunaelactis]NUK49917.1 cation acetate symporter [Streptomyces lunaelactis]NUK64206.1 cation acetate symporter [Streptomyces lunaelactis]NUK72196.1 cation acetate symporter [Streptomyces lunaelactis]NUK76551.1 cation acetate symporter [Streptomyces lunaelactis]
MNPEILLAAPGALDTDTRALVLVGFLTFIVPILFICVLSGPERDRVNDFYTAGRSVPPLRGALVLSGVYLSAATVLGTTGSVAVFGYDGLFIALCTVLSLGVLLLLARPLRERAGYTLGDIFALRAPGPAARLAAAVVTLSACVPYLVVQLSGAGVTTTALLGLSGAGAEQTAVIMIGALVVCATVFGGMRGTIVIQVIKTVVLLCAALAVTAALLHHFHWSSDSLIDAAGQGSGRPAGYMRPGLRFAGSTDPESTLDFVGLMITIVLGVACLPHVAMQLGTAPDAAAARRTVRHTIGIVGAFCLTTALMGFAAAALVGAPAIMAADPGGNSTLLLLTGELAGGSSTDTGGAFLVVLVSSAVFLTTLAVVASITLAAAAAVAHDLYTHVLRRGRTTEGREVAAARSASAAVGALSIGLAVWVQGWNVLFLSALSLAVAASCLLPALVYSLFWSGYTRAGLLWTLYGGLGCAVGLQICGPVFSGTPSALFPDWHLDWFPLQTVVLVSMPAAFLLGALGSVMGKQRVPEVAEDARA